jgi:hypothetical protein
MTTIKHCKHDTIMEIDPLNKFHDARSEQALVDACGFLIGWAVLGPEDENQESMENNLLDSYPFFMGWLDSDAVVDDIGEYTYPEDPPMYPLVSLHRGTETIHFYQYAMVAVRPDADTPFKITRMD